MNPIPAGPAAPTASVTVQPTCTTPTGTIVVTAPLGATIQYSVGGAYQASTTFSGLIPDNYNITAQDMTTGCISTATILTVNAVPNVPSAPSAGTNASYCVGDPMADLTATAGSGGTLTWYSDAGLTTVIGTGTTFTPFNVVGSTSYYVTEILGLCESTSTEVIITINPIPGAPIVGADESYCEGELIPNVTATATSGGTLTWYSDAGLTNVLGTGASLPINPALGTTTYYVTESVGGCEGSVSSVDITIFQNPIAEAGPNVTILSGESTQLNGSGGLAYLWNPPLDLSCTTCANPIASPSIDTYYYLTVVNANGCSDTDSVLITIAVMQQDLFIPNVFSPNGDNHNDFFEIEGTGLSDFYLRVFNRWGELVFESEDQSLSWDGMQHGKLLNTAVFAYTLTYTDSYGETQIVSGNVTLVK